MIEVKGLVKRFGSRYALRGVDLFVDKGEFAIILGPNGAGKTTLLRILATLSRPTCGFVSISGHGLSEDVAGIRRRLGVVTHQPMLYGDLTLLENLQFYGRMYDMEELDERIQEVLDLVGLSNRQKDLVRTLSRGMLQRLAIGRAVLHQPDLMLLDEPHSGLDQEAGSMLDEVLRQVSALGHTILLATHDLARAADFGNNFHILSKGILCYSTGRHVRIGADKLMQLYLEALKGSGGCRGQDAKG